MTFNIPQHNKKREAAALKLQAIVRGWLCRVKFMKEWQAAFDLRLETLPQPYSEVDLKALCYTALNFKNRSGFQTRIVSFMLIVLIYLQSCT